MSVAIFAKIWKSSGRWQRQLISFLVTLQPHSAPTGCLLVVDIGDLANMVLQYSIVNTRCGEGIYKCKTLQTQCQVIEAYTRP